MAGVLGGVLPGAEALLGGAPRLKFTCGALCASDVALNSSIGLEPDWNVLAQITLGKVRKVVL